MKCAVLIQARSASVRLPGKIYEPVPESSSPSILDHVVRRMQLANVGPVVVLIPEDDTLLADYLSVRRIEFLRGPHEDVRARYRHAARAMNLDLVVRATADNPALDPICAARSVREIQSRNLDLFSFSSMPLGTGVEVFTAAALLSDSLEGPEYSEHVSLHIKHAPDRFRVEHSPWREGLPPELPRLTVDTREDLEVVRSVFRKLGVDFTLDQLMELFASNPELFAGNRHVVQKTFLPPGASS